MSELEICDCSGLEMVVDETALLRDVFGSADFTDMRTALAYVGKHFSRETRSMAIGEASECLVALFYGAKRIRRNTRGYDLQRNNELIEVKARLISEYGNTLQFNFKSNTAKANHAFCLAWTWEDDADPVLEKAFSVTVPFLQERWGTPKQTLYCARTTLGQLIEITSAAAA
jgi:hypothetical protein